MTTKPPAPPRSSRRRALLAGASTAPALLVPSLLMPRPVRAQAPAVIASEAARPSLPYGMQFGDPLLDANRSARMIAWAHTDKPSRLQVEWSLSEDFADARSLPPLWLGPSSDHTGRIDLTGLPPGRRIHVRMVAQAIDSARTRSEPAVGSFITPSATPTDIRFVWGGDTAGQGWGISPNQGGMLTYRKMLEQRPMFFVHSGDTVYADNALKPEQPMPDGAVWRNVLTEEKSKVAETLQEFRGNYRYNLMDEHVRRFNQEVPQIWQWDDHEVTNNWSDGKDLSADDRYKVKNVPLLIARATQAFMEYAPLRNHGDEERDRVYRAIPYGPLLELFMIDMRSYRAANSANLQDGYDAASHFLGPQQLDWLERSLKRSNATWKIVCADMPIGLQVGDGKTADGIARWEAAANGDPGKPLGREQEIARLLSFIKREQVRNVVWLTADVHYCAAHHYSPERAAFKDFEPFWEFVSGPLHAGGFGPNATDGTFGPEVVFQKAPPTRNAPPTDDNQFFGQVDIDAATRAMTVALKSRGGTTVYETTLRAV